MTLHPLHGLEFLTTAAEWSGLPRGGAPEIAFAGRSNAGKSSAINALTRRKRLAYVSRTPGRTRHINFFRLPSGALLADLPGYGHAAVSATERRRWGAFLSRYLAERRSLVGLVLVMDARHPLTALDRRMLEWFLPTGRPVYALLTKADKLAIAERRATLAEVESVLLRDFIARGARVAVQLFSAVDGSGLAEAEEAIGAWLEGPRADRGCA
ncbi:MAG TPA: ribosome biogenesis GTP-binding protein YihA/YsxC [Casimicrobiaceae bacterium]|nr:ribosome biogenesis GTP-binding protein YihA/YsxC [Casimicrobiaceae bacterium]